MIFGPFALTFIFKYVSRQLVRSQTGGEEKETGRNARGVQQSFGLG